MNTTRRRQLQGYNRYVVAAQTRDYPVTPDLWREALRRGPQVDAAGMVRLIETVRKSLFKGVRDFHVKKNKNPLFFVARCGKRIRREVRTEINLSANRLADHLRACDSDHNWARAFLWFNPCRSTIPDDNFEFGSISAQDLNRLMKRPEIKDLDVDSRLKNPCRVASEGYTKYAQLNTLISGFGTELVTPNFNTPEPAWASRAFQREREPILRVNRDEPQETLFPLVRTMEFNYSYEGHMSFTDNLRPALLDLIWEIVGQTHTPISIRVRILGLHVGYCEVLHQSPVRVFGFDALREWINTWN